MGVHHHKTGLSDKNCLKFVHAGDLHLDSPFIGVSEISTELAGQLSSATFNAYEKIIEICIENEVDFLLVSGDIYDSSDKSLYAQLKFVSGLNRLSAAGIRAYIVHGNHDPLSGWSASLLWPENVHIMRGDMVECIPFESEGEIKAYIAGISYPVQHVRENLAVKFPSKERDWPFTIGLLHCTLGKGEGHEPYAACSEEDLVNTGYDYWALGHIHIPSVVREHSPAIIYAGNPQGRSTAECGPRGCYLVSVGPDSDVNPVFVETGSVRWEVAEVSITDIGSDGELIDRISGCLSDIRSKSAGLPVVCRILLTGRGPMHMSLVQPGFSDDLIRHLRDDELNGSDFVLVERIVDNTGLLIERDRLGARKDFAGDIVNIVDNLRSQPGRLGELRASLAPLMNSVSGRRLIEEISDEEFLEIISDGESLLLDRFVGSGEE